MIELVTTAVIVASSMLLFIYWFRYSCLLMLQTKTAKDYAMDVALAHHLNFANVQAQLSRVSGDLVGLRAALDQDYTVVMRLMEHTVAGQACVEQRMLAIHYRLMSISCAVGTHLSPRVARQALDEMSLVVAQFANSIGEAAASPSAA
jgi:hypothetical protein